MALPGCFFKRKLKKRARWPNINDARGDTKCRSQRLNTIGLASLAALWGKPQQGNWKRMPWQTKGNAFGKKVKWAVLLPT